MISIPISQGISGGIAKGIGQNSFGPSPDPVYNMPDGAPEMLFWQQSFTGATEVSLASGAVSDWYAKTSGLGGPFSQSTSGSRPAWDATDYEITFDGTDDYLRRSEDAGFLTSVPMPDATYGTDNVAGQGFTCTGLAYDPIANVFLVGNHGKGVSSAATFDASLVIINAAGVKINEIRMADLGLSAFGSMQGTAYDSQRDQYIVVSQGEGKVHWISKAGALVQSYTLGGVLNGLAYLPDTDTFFTLDSFSFCKEYAASTGVATGRQFSFTGMSDPDHIAYANGFLYAVEGPNGANIRFTYRDLTTGAQAAYTTLAGATAGEGIAIVGNRLYIANDGYFHGATPGGNKLMSYNFHQRAVNAFSVAIYGKLDAAPSGTNAIIFSSGDTDTYGFDILVPDGTDDQIQVVFNDGASTVTSGTITLAADLLTLQTIHINIDFVGGEIEVFQNGVSQGTASFSGAASTSAILGALTLGADGDAENPTAMTMMAMYGYGWLFDAANALELSDYIAAEAAAVVPPVTWDDAIFLAIATPHLWVEPFDATKFVGLSGNDFTSYTDKSSNAQTLAASASPKIGTRTIGGFDAFDMVSGARLNTQGPSLAAISAGDEWGFFFFQLDGLNGGINTLVKVTNSANSTRMTIGPFYGSSLVRHCRHTAGTVANTTWPGGADTNVHVLTWAIVGGTMTIWIDGNLSGTSTAQNITTTGGGLSFGGRYDNGSEGMDGGLGPFACYSGTATSQLLNDSVKYYLTRMPTGITYTDIP